MALVACPPVLRSKTMVTGGTGGLSTRAPAGGTGGWPTQCPEWSRKTLVDKLPVPPDRRMALVAGPPVPRVIEEDTGGWSTSAPVRTEGRLGATGGWSTSAPASGPSGWPTPAPSGRGKHWWTSHQCHPIGGWPKWLAHPCSEWSRKTLVDKPPVPPDRRVAQVAGPPLLRVVEENTGGQATSALVRGACWLLVRFLRTVRSADLGRYNERRSSPGSAGRACRPPGRSGSREPRPRRAPS